MCWRLVATIDYPPLSNIVPRLDNSEVAEISDPWCSEVPQLYECLWCVSPELAVYSLLACLCGIMIIITTLLCACCTTVRGGVVAWSPC